MKQEQEMIRFGDLSLSLKIIAVFGWIAFAVSAISFLIGFINALSVV